MADRKRTFVLVHPDEARRGKVASVLNGNLVASFASREGVAERIAEVTPDVVVAHYAGAKRLLQDVERVAPKSARVLLCSMSDPEAVDEIIEMAAEGHIFYAVDEDQPADELEKALLALVHMRNSARVDAAGHIQATVRAGGAEHRVEVVDLGNHGLALKLPVDAPVEWFVPGTLLEDVRVYRNGDASGAPGRNGPASGGSNRGDATFLAWPRAVVRHIRLVQDEGEPYFRAGVELATAAEDTSAVSAASSLRDPVRIQALLRRALRRGATLLLKSVDDSHRQVAVKEAVIQSRGRDGLIRCAPAPSLAAAPHDVVQLAFDLGGQSYRGLATVAEVGDDRLVISVPRLLTSHHRRTHLRFRPGADRPFAVSFTSPATGERIVRPVLDLHPHGLSFPFDASREVLPAGLHLDEVTLTLPNGTAARCRAEVKSIGAMPPGADGRGMALPFRCGLQLHDVPVAARQAILDAFVATRSPSVNDVHKVPFGDIWRLMGASMHPDYPFEGAHVPMLEQAYRKVASTGEGLSKSLVYTDGGRAVGHAAGLRVYSRTWMLMHLAVQPGYHRQEHIGREMSSLIIEYVEAFDDIDFVRFLWHTENRWPNRLAGWVARSMHTEGLTRLRYFHYLRKAFDGAPATDPGMRVREAGPSDLKWLEGHFRKAGEMVRLRADDLTAAEMTMPTLKNRFGGYDLHRQRRVFMVDGDNGPLAAALAEEATPGMYLAEFTNSFSLVTPEPKHPLAEKARAALTAHCEDHYRQLGRVSAVSLVPDGEVAEYEARGFTSHGRIAEWTFHRSTVRTWYNLSMAIFERLHRRQARSAKAVEEKAA
jgi:hypothetical protein